MPSAAALFSQPVASGILPELQSLFVDAGAKYQPLTHTMIVAAAPWPMPGAILQSLGMDKRHGIQAGASDRTQPPFELFFGQRAALNHYQELAQHVSTRVPLYTHDELQMAPWTFTLYKLAWEADAVSFGAPYKLIHGYPSGAVLTVQGKPDEAWPWMKEREQALKLSGHVAEAYCCQLVDLWTASANVLDVWAKRKVGTGNLQAEAEAGHDQVEPGHGEVGEQLPFFTQEDAAILKVLLQTNGVTMTVDQIVAKVSFSDKTIRTRLKTLREFGLVREPVKKKGHTTTAKGMDAAKKLPEDAGAKLIRSDRASR